MNEEKLDDFQDHVFGVADFVRTHLKASQYAPDDALPKTQWASPPRVSLGIDEHYLQFYVNASHPVFDTDNLSPIVAYLTYDKNDGLVLVWHSYEKASEKDSDQTAVYRRILSPFAKRMKLHYYDRKRERWDVTTKPQENAERNFELPDFIEIEFEKEEEEPQKSYIFLPKPRTISPDPQSKRSSKLPES